MTHLVKMVSVKRSSSALYESVADDRNEQKLDLYGFLVESLTEYAVFIVSATGRVVSWNSGAQKIFGYKKVEIIGRPFELIFTAEDAATGEPQAELDSAAAGGPTHHDRWHVRKDGTRFWGINTVEPLYDRLGTLRGFTKLVRDMTLGHQALAKLSDSEQQLRLLVESARDFAIFSIGSQGTIQTWNAGAELVFGYTQAEAVGRAYELLLCTDDWAQATSAQQTAYIADSAVVEHHFRRKDGSTFLGGGKTNKLAADPSGMSRGFVAIIHDITAAHAAEQDLRRRALYDALTQLPNRETFYEHVQRSIALFKRRTSSGFAVLFIDLDHFKAINDEFGHATADVVLVTIARRLETCIRSEDVVARVGGDEFAVLLNGINGPIDADDAAQRILSTMQSVVRTDAGDVFAALSVGIALGAVRHELPEDLMRDADAAMYMAKTQGRARAVAYDESIGTVLRDTVALTTALRHAVERNELRVAYQPVLRLADRHVVGFEALVRWKHPRRGLVLPAEFIPQAEDSHLIVAIDRWMIEAACRQVAMWRDRKLIDSTFAMSVNVSSREFSRDDFPHELQSILAANGLDSNHLRLEITEGALFERSPRAYATLAAIRTLGVNVDVDDFGTGYASLEALNDIFVDGLKIDWSFVTSKHAQHGWEIIEAVISLAHKLGLIAIAEGIETQLQLERLIALGCDLGQGHLFAPPLGAVAATALLAKSHAR